MKKWITPTFWTLVAGIGLCLIMTIVTGIQESKQAESTITTTDVVTPAQ